MPRLANTESKREGLPKHEWLFADRKLLLDDETDAAYFWEFGLETPDVIAEVEAVRKKQVLSEKVDKEVVRKWNSANPFPGVEDNARMFEWSNRFQKQFPNYIVITKFRNYDAHFLHAWPEFPDKHWLQVSQDVRHNKKRLRPHPGQMLGNPTSIFDPNYWLEKDEAKKFDTVPSFFYKTDFGLACHTSINTYLSPVLNFWRDWIETTKSPWGFASADRWDELRLVEINWARSDRKLKADFAEWLKENRPDDRQAFHKSKESSSRRTTHRDLLKSLGAWRLLRHFKRDWNSAAEYSELFCKDKRGNPKPLYVEQSEWRDAENRANKALSEFFKKVFG